MPSDFDAIHEMIRALPKEAFQEPSDAFLRLTPLERLRWLQETALFIWKYKGIAQTQTREPSTAPIEPVAQLVSDGVNSVSPDTDLPIQKDFQP